MKYVYLLWHTNSLNDDIKLIGVYSSEKIAMEKITVYKKIPGFCDDKEGFEVSKYQIDRDHWTEGFISEE